MEGDEEVEEQQQQLTRFCLNFHPSSITKGEVLPKDYKYDRGAYWFEDRATAVQAEHDYQTFFEFKSMKEMSSGRTFVHLTCSCRECHCNIRYHLNSKSNQWTVTLPTSPDGPYSSLNFNHSASVCSSESALTCKQVARTTAIKTACNKNKRRIPFIHELQEAVGNELGVGKPSESVIKTSVKWAREDSGTASKPTTVIGLRVYLQEFERLNPGGCHEVFLDENGVYDGVFSMAGIAPSMFKEVCQRYLSIDACVHFLAEGVQSGHSFIGEFETATHSILPGALGLGYGETNDCWMRFMTCIIKGFKNESLEHESYFNNPQTIVAADRRNSILNALSQYNVTRRADVRHILQDNLNGKNISSGYIVANACTEEQLTRAIEKFRKENKTAYDYVDTNVGLDCFSRVRLCKGGGCLYGKESGVMGNDSECQRFKVLGIRDAAPLSAIVKYHELLQKIVNNCILHANSLRSSNQLLCQFAHQALHRYKSSIGQFNILPNQGLDCEVIVQRNDEPHQYRTVDWKNKTCTCFFWQGHAMICEHAYCVARHFNVIPQGGIQAFLHHAFDRSYHASTWKEFFTLDKIIHLPDMSLVDVSQDVLKLPENLSKSKKSKRYKGGNDSTLRKKKAKMPSGVD